jgi:hypothetical protein
VRVARPSAPAFPKGQVPCHFLDGIEPDVARYSARQAVVEMIAMRKLVLAAFAAISLTAGIAPMAHAFTSGFYHNTYHSGPYDNTGHGPGETGMEGGGG